jgi:hypothetical protein
MTGYPPRPTEQPPIIDAAPRSIPPPPQVNPSSLIPPGPMYQPTHVLLSPIDRNRPHQSSRECERRRRQLERKR